MFFNNFSAIKASFIMHELPQNVLDHPRIAYFVRAVKINRPLSVIQRNIKSLEVLSDLVYPV